jgi:hypothetical protein
MKPYIVLVCLLLLPVSLRTQPKGTLKGTISDAETGKPVPEAYVVLKGTPKGSLFGVEADHEGKFSRSEIPVGKYKLTVTTDFPYRIPEKDITIISDSVTVVNIALRPFDPDAEDATADLAKGIALIFVNAWPVYPVALDSLTRAYGFQYEYTNCWPKDVSRYNKVVFQFLDSLHGGPQWQTEFRKAEKALYDRWQKVR